MEKEKQMPAAAENTTEIDPALCRPVGSKLDTDQIVRPSVSYWAGVWRRLKQDKLAIACALLLLVLILLAIFAPIFSPYRYDQTDLLSSNLSPSADHWFRTDSAGRDMWTRVWVGARVSLAVGFIGAILPFLIGMFVGSVAGWFGGWVDMAIMRVIDIGLCIPSMIYVILILVYFGGRPPGDHHRPGGHELDGPGQRLPRADFAV